MGSERRLLLVVLAVGCAPQRAVIDMTDEPSETTSSSSDPTASPSSVPSDGVLSWLGAVVHGVGFQNPRLTASTAIAFQASTLVE